MGIFNACNLSVSTMTICGIVIWEIEKKIKQNRRNKILILNLIGFIILILATRTRTVLFLLPYWLLQCNRYFDKKIFIPTIVILGISFASIIANTLITRMNIEGGDSSSNTRAILYIALIYEILNNYIIIPHGSNEAFFFIKNLTGDSGFSSHNDILRYLYDWGGYFFIFIIYLIINIKKYVKFNLEFNLILLGFSAFALHNMLFLPITWIPLCIIIHLRERDRSYPKKQLSRKKLHYKKQVTI